METKRIFLAGFLIILVWVVWQTFFFPFPEELEPREVGEKFAKKDVFVNQGVPDHFSNQRDSFFEPREADGNNNPPVLITIENSLFKAVLSSRRLGTFLSYSLIDNKSQHKGSFVNRSLSEGGGFFDKNAPVEFVFGEEDGFYDCNPCLEGFNPSNVSVYVDGVLVDLNQSLIITEKSVVRFVDNDSGVFHELLFLPDSYSVRHDYVLNNESNLNLLWKNGIRPSEKYYWLDDQMSYAMYVGDDDSDYDWLTGPYETSSLYYGKEVGWVGVRNKFFISTIKPLNRSSGLKISPGDGTPFSERFDRSEPNLLKPPSVYDISLSFDKTNRLSFNTFMAPLDYNIIKNSDIENLDWVMTLGGSVFRPISKFIINLIQTLKHYIPFGGYAVVLIVFAFLVRVVSGPLTKRAMDSTRKMTEMQPIIKKIQTKYKSDPKKMQMKIMQAYKEHNANPLSGCLLMFLQWPIMIPPFIIFRSTIELRGESFLWVPDLAQPDYLITLPFNIPLIGFGNETGVGLLPILMGVTLFLTMKQTSSNLEGQNKVMLYSMNGMFVLLFNSFPAGLNLYYVVYNLLNYLQQKKNSPKK